MAGALSLLNLSQGLGNGSDQLVDERSGVEVVMLLEQLARPSRRVLPDLPAGSLESAPPRQRPTSPPSP